MNVNLSLLVALIVMITVKSAKTKLLSQTKLKLNLNDIPEITMTIDQLLSHRNFKFQVHNVTTEDCYILKLFRILPKNKTVSRVVLLQHGLFVSIKLLINRIRVIVGL